MFLKVSRKQVIQAIQNEPLRGRSWFHYIKDKYGINKNDAVTGEPVRDKKLKNNLQCAVCAVGGILDQSLGKTYSRNELGQFASDVVKHTHLENFLDAHNQERRERGLKPIPKPKTAKEMVKVARIAAREGLPLSALSGLFEGLYAKKGFRTKQRFANRKLRNVLEKFVKSSFPKRIKADEYGEL